MKYGHRSTSALILGAGLIALASSAAMAQQAPGNDPVYFSVPTSTTPASTTTTTTPASTTTTTIASTTTTTTTTSTTTTKPVQVAGVQVVQGPNTQVLGANVERRVAFTGANSKPLAAAGIGLTGLGVVLLVGARRRKQPTPPSQD